MVQQTFTKSTLLANTGMTTIPVDADNISAEYCQTDKGGKT